MYHQDIQCLEFEQGSPQSYTSSCNVKDHINLLVDKHLDSVHVLDGMVYSNFHP